MRGSVRVRPGRLGLGTCLAIALMALTAGDALGLTWLSNTALATGRVSYAYPGALAVSSTTTAHAIYEEGVVGTFVVEYRRTTNSGASWSSPVPLSSPEIGEAGVPSIDAYGNAVDAVWVEGDSIIASSDSALVYRRSTDAGVTWQAPVHLSPLFESAGLPRVAHSGSLVVVTWTDQASGKIWVRVSTNGGASFGSRINLATTTNKPYPNLYDGFPVVSIGSGVVVVGYYAASKTLRIRRSTTSGSTWRAAQSIATNASGTWPAAVSAAGSTVLVGYAPTTSTDIWTVVRRSTDKGATFGSAIALSPSSSTPSFQPVITYRAGAFRAIFERCTSNSCSLSNTLYRSSTTGASWSTAIAASVRKTQYESPADVDVATKVLVLYDDQDSNGNDAYIRRGG
jgi:hypothetical protein